MLQIRATDMGVPSLSSFVMLNIEVTDVNDNPPLFTQTNYTVIVQVPRGFYFYTFLIPKLYFLPNNGFPSYIIETRFSFLGGQATRVARGPIACGR